MKNNPYKDLPPLECRPDGSLYRMTPAQRKRASALIRRECCCCVNTPPETVPLDRTNGAAKPLKWCMVTAAMVH